MAAMLAKTDLRAPDLGGTAATTEVTGKLGKYPH